MSDLFAGNADGSGADSAARLHTPLADQLRPKLLTEVIGQEHLTGEKGALGQMVTTGHLSSIILWGRPAPEKPASPCYWAKP